MIFAASLHLIMDGVVSLSSDTHERSILKPEIICMTDPRYVRPGGAATQAEQNGTNGTNATKRINR